MPEHYCIGLFRPLLGSKNINVICTRNISFARGHTPIPTGQASTGKMHTSVKVYASPEPQIELLPRRGEVLLHAGLRGLEFGREVASSRGGYQLRAEGVEPLLPLQNGLLHGLDEAPVREEPRVALP